MAFSIRVALTAVLVVGMATVAAGQADPIKARQAMMKANGGAVGSLVKIVKGESQFDATTVKTALETLHNSTTYAELFPVGSDQGDTKALPTVWSDNAGFKAALAKMIAADEALIANPPKDVDGVKAALGALGPTCKGCHDTYRKPAS